MTASDWSNSPSRMSSLRRRMALSSANSINIGRLLPQMTYFAAASLRDRQAEGRNASFVIPSGNLGHAVACIWAREMGLPIGDIVLAHNANRTVPDFPGDRRVATTTEHRDRSPTAMDVGDPSNMERLSCLYGDHAAMSARIRAVSVDDERSARAFAENSASRDRCFARTAPWRLASTAAGAAERRRISLGAGGDRAPGEVSGNRRADLGERIELPPALAQLPGPGAGLPGNRCAIRTPARTTARAAI